MGVLAVLIVAWLITCRFGEADNPGPCDLAIATCNPTTIWNKQEQILKLCPAIVGLSETAATQQVQAQLSKWYKDRCLFSHWSAPVGTQGTSTAGFRGLAGGTAIVSSYPIRSSLIDLPPEVCQSTRFCDAHIQIVPHRFLYMASIYGPTVAYKYADHIALRDCLFNQAVERAMAFRGPAVIVGDFNAPLESLASWAILQRNGWIDTAEVSSRVNGHQLEPTSCNTVRHSFILANPELARSLKSCRTTNHHMFSTHPVLKAVFDTDCLCMPTVRWTLPRSFDAYQADFAIAQATAQELLLKSSQRWTEALQHQDVDELARRWTNTAEQVLANSAVDVEGNLCKITNAHMGRSRKNPLKKYAQIAPLNKRARDGDFQSSHDQCSTKMRQQLKQLHRLQSAVRQFQSLANNYNSKAHCQLQQLWEKIIHARGYPEGFAHWVRANLCIPVSTWLPSLEILVQIKNEYATWYSTNEAVVQKSKQAINKIELIEDWEKGGRIAFSKVRATELQPLTTIKNTIKCQVRKVAWSKEGKNTSHALTQLDLTPICQ